MEIIEKHAFQDTKIISFWLPQKLTYIDESVFNKCNSLQIIEITNEKQINLVNSPEFQKNKKTMIMVTVAFKSYLDL